MLNAPHTAVVHFCKRRFDSRYFVSHSLGNMSMQVLKLRAICSHCRKEAAFTHRIGHEEDIEVKPTQACLGVLPGYLYNFLSLVLQVGARTSIA